ncbi:MAG TPA: amidase family protein [Streptosporangiaceae bacterium]|nr:amidase family protein [Streptosporangiaceae bacterium]
MQLTIIGAGAIGGTIGAHMIRDGHDVLLCDADRAHVEAINRRGLSICGPVENFTVQARAVLPDGLPATLPRAAVATKSHHTAAAAELLRGRLAPDGYVVSFQNGLTTGTLSAAVGPGQVLAAFVNFGADWLEPGVIMQGNVGTFRVGEPGGGISERVRELAAALPYAEPTGNILGFLWGKEAYGAMLYAGAVSDLPIADSLADPRWRPLMLAIAREVLAQAPVRPEAFDGFDPADLEGSLARLVTFNRRSAKSHSGIYRDLMVRKRKTEVDDLLRDLKGPLTTFTGELIHAIERGERTCEVANLELLAAYERALRLGTPLNAVVSLFPAPARRPDGPLRGVPIAVKDMIDMAGHPRGNGNPHDMAAAPAAGDARVVRALREAGADVFAATSLLEYAAGAVHPGVPEARNPYDPGRTAGGSSGGSAALVGAGVCPAALGTDTGGSIRIPAHYCGIAGFKPSSGAIDAAGVQPLSPSLDHVGILGADVAATARVFAAITGQAITGPAITGPAITGPDITGPDITGQAPAGPPATLRLGLARPQLDHPGIRPPVAAALRAALGRLREAFPVADVDGSILSEIAGTFGEIFLWEAWQVHRAQAETHPERYGPETLRLLRTARNVTKDAYRAALRRRDELLPRAAEVYRGTDVLLTPAAPFTAPATTPPVDTPEGELEGLFTAPFNLTGDPALVLPCGWDGALPVGIQLSAPRGADLPLLAAASLIEEALAFERRAPAGP